MNWADCLKKNKTRKATPDRALVRSLVEMTGRRLEFIRQFPPLTTENASIVFVEYYEMLREMVDAISAQEGYKVYSHECLGYFLKEVLHEEIAAMRFDRFRILRNGVNYYGEPVSKEETEKAIRDMAEMAGMLKEKYLKISR